MAALPQLDPASSLPIVQRLRDAAAGVRQERVSMRTMAQVHGPVAHGTLLLLPTLIVVMPIPVGHVLPAAAVALIGLGLAAWGVGSEWINGWIAA